MKKIIPIAILTFVLAIGAFIGSAQAGTSSLTGWAWSSNIGWVSFNSANSGAGGGDYSVKISTTTPIDSDAKLLGYAWSDHIGWISFEPTHVNGCPTASPTAPCQATVNMNTGAVTGWARARSGIGRTDGWDGWIHLSGTNHSSPDDSGTRGVTYYPEAKSGHTVGSFAGYAWGSDVVGWLNFYNVATAVGGIVSNPYLNACSIYSVTPVGNTAFTVNLTTPANPAGPYELRLKIGSGSYIPVSSISLSGTITINDPISGNIIPDVSYTYQIFVVNTETKCGPPSSRSITSTPVGSGIDLYIGRTAAVAEDSIPPQKTLPVKKGDQFYLVWNIDTSHPANNFRIEPSNTFASSNWNELNSINFKRNTDSLNIRSKKLNTTGVDSGTYTFKLQYLSTADNRYMDGSTVTLKVVGSSIREK